MNIVKKNTIKTNLYELELELKKQRLEIIKAIELLSGYNSCDIINEIIVKNVSYQFLKQLTKNDYIYEKDDKEVNHGQSSKSLAILPRKTEKNLIKIIPLTEDRKEKEIIERLDNNCRDASMYKFDVFKTRNFKLVRRSNHLSLAHGNVIITTDGKIIDPFKETRRKM